MVRENLPWDCYLGSSRRVITAMAAIDGDIRIIGRLRYAYLRYMQRPAYLLALKRLKLIVAPSKYMARTIAGDFPRTPILHIYNRVLC